jgi:hypothetical protein
MDEYVDEIKVKNEKLKRTKIFEIGTTESGTKEVKDLFNSIGIFDYPKPHTLIKYFIAIATNSNDLILDFFAGSGTTAHAVMQLNAEDGGNRKFIMVQLDEPTAENSEARKAGYETIDQISRKRIERAAEKIVDSGQFSVISFQNENTDNKNLKTENYKLKTTYIYKTKTLEDYDCIKLPRANSLAKGNGTHGIDLQVSEKITSGRTLFSERSDAQSGSVNTEQYSRGTGQANEQGVYSISDDSQRVKSGIGNAAANMRESRIPCRYGYFGSHEIIAGNRENADCPYFQTENCPLKTENSLDLGFKHYRLTKPEAQTLDKIMEFDPDESKLIDDDMITPLGGLETILQTWLIDDGYPFDTEVQVVDFAGYTAHYVDDSLLYLISQEWGAEQIKALLNKIGTNDLNINTIIVYAYSFTMESLRELEMNVKNTLDKQILIEKRY